MTAASEQILFPPGRVVQGSLYKAQDKDFTTGQPRVFPAGHPKAGQPKISYFFAVAVPKVQGETAWWDTVWGKRAVAVATAAWPRGEWQTPTFAWKMEDGDSLVPNKKGRKNAETEGFPGNWIINFSSGYPPKIFLPVQGGAAQPIVEPDVVKLGFWVEVLGSLRSNETQGNPGIYVNHDMVAFRGRDKEIFAGPDPATIPFGQSAVPSHVTMAPIAGAAGFPAAVPGAPGVPGQFPSPAGLARPGVPGGMPSAGPGAPTMVQPSASFIAPPGGVNSPVAPAGVGAPPAPSHGAAPPSAYVDPLGAPAGHRMANPQGATYQAYRTNNWSDAQMIAQGAMVRL